MTSAIVLGAGVIGAATAIAARAAGFDVQIVADRRMSDGGISSDPEFASAYAAASITPHSVASPHIAEMFALSETVFEQIRSADPSAGVSQRQHFELWEQPVRLPPYAPLLRNRIDIARLDAPPPIKRTGARTLSGYRFDSYFADMQPYRRWLDALIERAGVLFKRRRLSADIVGQHQADIVFNCLGVSAPRIFPELEPGFILRGVTLVFDTEAPLIATSSGAPVSYNYTPHTDIYPAPEGGAGDLYFYPRQRSAVLGGLRQPAMFDPEQGRIDAMPMRGEVLSRDGVEFPRAMLEVNRELIEQLTGMRLGEEYRALVGYRYLLGTPDRPSLVVAPRERSKTALIDCLGFGGAGVTLAWGGAARAVSQARSLLNLDGARGPEDFVAHELAPFLSSTVASAAG